MDGPAQDGRMINFFLASSRTVPEEFEKISGRPTATDPTLSAPGMDARLSAS